MKIVEDNWTADLLVSPQQSNGFMQCTASVIGSTKAHALDGAKAVLDLFAKGREAFIRTAPEAATEKDFDTKEVRHLGYVRFHVRFGPGEWSYPSEADQSLPFVHITPKPDACDHDEA